MRWFFQRRPARSSAGDVDAIAAAKRQLELTDLRLGVRERTLKIDAIERVAQSEPDPVTALEVISVATHRGRMPPTLYTRRKAEQSPLETMAMAMLQKRLDEDPTDALDRILDRRERLEDAADRLTGRSRNTGEEGTGNTIVDVARAVANSPLGEAVGQVLGAGMQQRMAEAAAAQGRQPPGATPTPPSLAPPLPEAPAAAVQASPPPPTGGPRPTSFRVGMALRVLKSLNPGDRARWILAQSDQHPELAELIGPFIDAETDTVPLILEAYLTEAAAGGDAAVLEWVPLVEHFRDNLAWALETHAELRALTFEPDQDVDEATG